MISVKNKKGEGVMIFHAHCRAGLPIFSHKNVPPTPPHTILINYEQSLIFFKI